LTLIKIKISLEAVSLDSIKELVKTELQTYDADKTGRTDYALESSGLKYINKHYNYILLIFQT
jgi:hypothetical protein